MAHPLVIIVDEHDAVIGSARLEEVWQKGLYHRIVRIMVEDDQGRILLQKRSADMELYPNCWGESGSGHVDAGETYDHAAVRELKEEVGIKGLPLKAIANYQTHGTYQGRILNRFNRVYRARFTQDTPMHADREEVSDVQWFTLATIRELIANHPDQVTDGLTDVIKSCYPA